MRLALIGPVYPYRGGIAHYTTLLHRALQARSHQVLLISFKRQYPRWLFPGESDRDPSREPLTVHGAEYRLDSLNPFTWLLTFRRIRQHNPQALILPWWTTFWAPAWFTLGVLQRLLLRRKLIIICHNVLPHERRRWDTWLTRLTLCMGDAFIVQSHRERERLRELLPHAPIEIVPHPVYEAFRAHAPTRERARRQLGLSLKEPVLLFFGIVRGYKGLQDLIDALPEVQARLGPIRLVVAGEFWDDIQAYTGQIEALGLSECVIILDRYIPNEEVGTYFSAADLLVAPYRRVTGSGVVQLAQGFGLPVVTSTETTTEEHLIVTFPPGDIQALAKAIVRLLQSPTPEQVGKEQNTPRAIHWSDLAERIEQLILTGEPKWNKNTTPQNHDVY